MHTYKPLWAEGVLLSPQYFQQQERWDFLAQQSLGKLAQPFPWGMSHLRWDEALLVEGKLRIEQLTLRLPDGTLIDTRQTGITIPARDLQAIPASVQQLLVSVGLPLWNAYGQNCQEDGLSSAQPRRFTREYCEVRDLFGEDSAQMAVERPNLHLLFDFEKQDDFVTCPVMRLVRDAQGQFIADPYYIPPATTLQAHQELMKCAERLSDLLHSRSLHLSSRRRERSNNLADFSVSDATLFWFLHSLNSAWPELAHFHHYPQRHPEQLYCLLARLCGTLTTFSLEENLQTTLEYQHLDLYRTFSALEERIRELLETVIPSPVMVIDLERIKATQWRGRFLDARLADGADFYLSVRSTLPMQTLQERLPLLCKIGSPDEVERIINSAVTGVPLRTLSRLPSALPVRMENAYFALDSHHPAFTRMLEAQACSVYVPASLPEVSLELYAVLKS